MAIDYKTSKIICLDQKILRIKKPLQTSKPQF